MIQGIEGKIVYDSYNYYLIRLKQVFPTIIFFFFTIVLLFDVVVFIFACFQSQDVGIKTIVMLDQQGGKTGQSRIQLVSFFVHSMLLNTFRTMM